MAPIEHIPVAPPRPCTPGEGIYLTLWREFIAARPDDFEDIFSNMTDTFGQRAASVAASFMVFMGCNGGASFTHAAERLVKSANVCEQDAYLAAWAIENARHRGVNNGLRTVEYMLAPIHPIRAAETFQHGVDWNLVPNVSMLDMDVIECMVVWWSSFAAKRLRDVAEAHIMAANKKRQSGIFDAVPSQR